MSPDEHQAATRPQRLKFEETKKPQDFLRWLNAYTNEHGADHELHALCSWAHSVVNASPEAAPRRRISEQEEYALVQRMVGALVGKYGADLSEQTEEQARILVFVTLAGLGIEIEGRNRDSDA